MKVKNNCNTNRLCKNGCGFYGSSQFNDLCSKCYKALTNGNPRDGSFSEGLVYKPVVAQNLPDTSNIELAKKSSQVANGNEKKIVQVFGNINDPSTSKLIPQSVSPTSKVTPPNLTIVNHEPVLTPSSEIVEPVSILELSPEPTRRSSALEVNRCGVCKKRLGLTAISCRCGKLFCAYHRYSDRHKCTFDYQVQAQNDIRRDNPTVRAEKVKKL